MKERPILFSAPMVRAILDGRKTQTRRVVKPQPSPELLADYAWIRATRGSARTDAQMLSDCLPCPYGQPGDRLWVRETWAYSIHALAAERDEDGPFVYAATNHGTQGRLCDRWRPSIHMPRAASRITLEITAVRVERLQDISEADAIAEGIVAAKGGGYHLADTTHYGATAVDAYASLFEHINGPGSWDANPYVWVIEFKRV